MVTSDSNTNKTVPVYKKAKRFNKRRVALSRLKRRVLKHVWLVRALILSGALIGVGIIIVLTLLFVSRSKVGGYYSLARNFILTPAENIKSFEGRTNILILGKGGANHEAPDLTDTIIFASIDNVGHRVTLISIPRDIWIPSIRAKVNSAYYWGNQKKPPESGDSILRGGGGLVLAKSAVEEIVGQPVHYGVVVDFEVFKNIIDVMGGVEVDVEASFTDEKYPIEGKEDNSCGGDPEYRCRYETVSFEKGLTPMDGETALKFSRSRNAEGDEGTDFARSIRQQKVIDAIKKKALSKEILYSPKKLLAIKDVLEENVETDIDDTALAILARRAWQAKNNIGSDILPEDLLENPPISLRYDNQYVFIPKSDDPETPENEWDEVYEWIQEILSK